MHGALIKQSVAWTVKDAVWCAVKNGKRISDARRRHASNINLLHLSRATLCRLESQKRCCHRGRFFFFFFFFLQFQRNSTHLQFAKSSLEGCERREKKISDVSLDLVRLESLNITSSIFGLYDPQMYVNYTSWASEKQLIIGFLYQSTKKNPYPASQNVHNLNPCVNTQYVKHPCS